MSEGSTIITKQFSGGTYIKNTGTNELIFILPKVRDWMRIVFFSIWLLGWLFFISLFTWAACTEKADAFIYFIIVFLLFVGILAFFQLKWNLYGKEKITFYTAEIKIEKINHLFSKPKYYLINTVKDLRIGEGSGEETQLHRGGKIIFDHGGSEKRFGIDLTDWEAKFVVETIKKERKLD